MIKPPKKFNPGAEEIEAGTVFSPRLLFIPNIEWVWATLAGVISDLLYVNRWREDGFATSPDDAVQIFQAIYGAIMRKNPLTGTVVQYLTQDPPPGVLPMDGVTRQRADYPELWTVLDGSLKLGDTFTLPNVNGRFLLGGSTVGEAGGLASVTLDISQMPTHTHDTLPHAHGEVIALPNITTIGPGVPEPTAIPGVGTTSPAGVTVVANGGGLPHENMPPYTVVKIGVWY